MHQLTLFENTALFCLVVSGLLLPFSRYNIIKGTVSLLGLVFLGLIIGHNVYDWWQGHWTIGWPYLTPYEIVGPDGRHLDGTPVSQFSNSDPVGWWCFYLFMIGLFSGLWWFQRSITQQSMRKRERGRAISEQLKRDIAALEHLPPGERDKAVRLLMDEASKQVDQVFLPGRRQ